MAIQRHNYDSDYDYYYNPCVSSQDDALQDATPFADSPGNTQSAYSDEHAIYYDMLMSGCFPSDSVLETQPDNSMYYEMQGNSGISDSTVQKSSSFFCEICGKQGTKINPSGAGYCDYHFDHLPEILVAMGQKVSEARQACNFSIADLAQRTGIDEYKIERYESALRLPSMDTVEKMAYSTGFPVEYFDEALQLAPPMHNSMPCNACKISDSTVQKSNSVVCYLCGQLGNITSSWGVRFCDYHFNHYPETLAALSPKIRAVREAHKLSIADLAKKAVWMNTKLSSMKAEIGYLLWVLWRAWQTAWDYLSHIFLRDN